jgi:hypothetical protein
MWYWGGNLCTIFCVSVRSWLHSDMNMGRYWYISLTMGRYWYISLTMGRYWYISLTMERYWYISLTMEHYWYISLTMGRYWYAFLTAGHNSYVACLGEAKENRGTPHHWSFCHLTQAQLPYSAFSDRTLFKTADNKWKLYIDCEQFVWITQNVL